MEAVLDELCASAGPQAAGALGILAKILGNITDQPREAKFRKLNRDSAKLQSGLLQFKGSGKFLAASGFVALADGGYDMPQGKEGALLAAASAAVARRCELLQAAQPALEGSAAARNCAAYREVVQGGAKGAGLVEARALAQAPGGAEALQLLERILMNLRRYPGSEKYRCVKLAKASGQKVLLAAPLLQVAGFQRCTLPSGEECLQVAHPNVDVIERVWAMVYWTTRPGPPPALPAASGLLAHALGAVLGVAVGDALGAPLGGRGPLEVSALEVDKAMEMCGGGLWGVAPGQATGHSELTACLATALAEAAEPLKELPLEALAVHYGRWGKSQPFRGDRACLHAFLRPRAAADMAERAREVNQKSMGSGALLRCAPLAALGAAGGCPAVASALAREDAQLSHPNPSVCNASAAYVAIAGHLIAETGDRRAALEKLQQWTRQEQEAVKRFAAAGDGLQGWAHLSRGAQPPMGQRAAAAGGGVAEKPWEAPGEHVVAHEVVVGWLTRALGDAELAFSEGSKGALLNAEVGSVDIPLSHALRHVKLGSTFEVAMRAVLAGGSDSSATAAAVGGLVGAAVGVQGIPERWVRAVLTCDPSLGQPRPLEYLPASLPDLVTRLCARAGGAGGAAALGCVN